MSALTVDRRLLLPRPRRTALRALVGALPLVAILAILAPRGAADEGLLLLVLVAAGQVSLAVTTAHKEVMAATTSFFQPGLRRGVGLAQLLWAMVLAAAATAAMALAVPALAASALAAVFGLALVLHAVLALVTLRSWLSFQLQAWLYYAFMLIPLVQRAPGAADLEPLLWRPLPWLAAGLLLLAVLVRHSTSSSLWRRLSGRFVLASEDMFRPGRIQDFKESRGCHRRAGAGLRWRSRLLEALLARGLAARDRGDAAATRAWQLLSLDVAVNVSTRRWVPLLVVAAMLGMMLFFGYYDGRRTDSDLDRWFVGLVYQWAAFPLFSLTSVLLAAGPAAASRRTALRAELVVMGTVTAVIAAAAVLTAGLMDLAAAALPPVTWRGEEVFFQAARPHGIWLVPMLAPFAWLAVALRPRPRCALSNLAVSPLFILGHAVMTAVPYGIAVPVGGAAALAAGAAAYVLRRRWWRRADLAL